MIHKINSIPQIMDTTGENFDSGLGLNKLSDSMPQHEMASETAYELIHAELMRDGDSRRNLATFVTTWMEPEARRLMSETSDKNMIDKDVYPHTAKIEKSCVNMIAKLYHGQTDAKRDACGCSTTGSSEAAMICGLAMKWNWRKKRAKQGLNSSRPNLVMGADVQVCWEKFCLYWDVEMRIVPMSRANGYRFSPQKAIELCDENTIGILGILGTTYTGEYQDVKTLNDLLDNYNKKTKYDIPIHVDAASGGFISPFLNPELEWDFRLKWVKSINVSGHKFGLVAPGVGWAIWKSWNCLPEELIFHVNYLGGKTPTFALSFSRPSSQVVVQYYNFIRFGFEGYKKIHKTSMAVTYYLKDMIESSGIGKTLMDDIKMPLLAFKLKGETDSVYNVYRLSEKLRLHGWQVPAYTLAKGCEDISILRIVVKDGFSRDMADLLVQHIKEACKSLKNEINVADY
jgi:glutamate decarboxylase